MSRIAAALVVTLALLAPPAAAASIVDSFEGDTLGLFPSGWLDVGQIDPGSVAPNPSAVVVSTTNAFGAPTKAVSIVDAAANSQGLYLPLAVQPYISISVDVRVDRFGGAGGFPTSDWPLDITLSQLSGPADPAFVPSMGIYVANLTETWQSFVIPTGPHPGDGADFGTGVTAGTWYNVQLDLQPLAGVMRTRITDIATSALLLDRTDVYAGWTEADGQYNAVSFFDGELSGVAPNNLVVLDNIRVLATPEPTSLALLALGVAGLAVLRRRRRS